MNLLKKKVGKPGRHEGDDDDDDEKVNITDGLCLDGDVPPYRILPSVHESGTSSELSLQLSLSVMSSHVPWSKVSGSLVQMFQVFT